MLPFQNMSGDPEQEYFVDGLVEEIITGLSRSKALFVIARNSSFTYKGAAVDVRQVGRELGVRYVLEGSVRKAGNRLRITGQLVEAANGVHLWADRFDGDLADIFELQDQITSQVIGAIAPRLELAEIERARRKTTNLDAYDYYLRAWAAIYRYSREGSQEALALLEKAIALDPEFALAYATQAVCYFIRRAFSWSIDPAHEAAEAERTAQRAMELDSSDAQVLTFYAQTLIYNVGRLDEAVSLSRPGGARRPELCECLDVARQYEVLPWRRGESHRGSSASVAPQPARTRRFGSRRPGWRTPISCVAGTKRLCPGCRWRCTSAPTR